MGLKSEFLETMGPSAIRNITGKIREKKREGVSIVNFAGGMPDKNFFPYKELVEITKKVVEEEGAEVFQYAATDGYDPLREELAKLMKRYGVDVGFQNILVTSGSQQALNYIAKAMIEKGDCVVCEAPSYVGALDTIRAYGAKLIGISMDDEGMNMDELEEVLKSSPVKFIYTIPDCQNPSGRNMSAARRKRLAELACRYDTYVVEDSPYSMLSFSGELLPAVKSFDMEDRVVFLGSVSKTICPGVRVGWMAADTGTLFKIACMKQRDDLQVNNLAQRQVYGFMKDYDYDAHLKKICEIYKRRRDVMIESVQKYFPADVKVVVPQGGIFLWMEFEKGVDTLEMFDEIFEENLAYVPGTFFYPDRSGLNTMRLNFCTNSEQVIKTEMARMGRLMKALLKKK